MPTICPRYVYRMVGTLRFAHPTVLAVIASETKQSTSPHGDRWIASSLQRKIALQFCRELLAMTVEGLLTYPAERNVEQASRIAPESKNRIERASQDQIALVESL